MAYPLKIGLQLHHPGARVPGPGVPGARVPGPGVPGHCGKQQRQGKCRHNEGESQECCRLFVRPAKHNVRPIFFGSRVGAPDRKSSERRHSWFFCTPALAGVQKNQKKLWPGCRRTKSSTCAYLLGPICCS